MSILMTLRIALKALNRNKMRTMLTMLGMIIGVGAVITMVALGKGAQTTIEEQVKAAGTNMINVMSGNFSQGGVRMGQGQSNTLMPEDAEALREVPGVQYVAAGASTRGQVVAGNQNWSTHGRGDRRRHAADPQLADEVRLLLLTAGRQRRRQGGGARQRRRRHAVRAGRRPDRGDRSGSAASRSR